MRFVANDTLTAIMLVRIVANDILGAIMRMCIIANDTLGAIMQVRIVSKMQVGAFKRPILYFTTAYLVIFSSLVPIKTTPFFSFENVF